MSDQESVGVYGSPRQLQPKSFLGPTGRRRRRQAVVTVHYRRQTLEEERKFRLALDLFLSEVFRQHFVQRREKP